MKKIITVFVAVVLLVVVSGCESSSSDKKDELVVGMELAYPPFETKDESGNPSGVSVDIALAFGEYLGKDVKIVNTAWDGLIPSLKTDGLDMVISSMTVTPERSEEVLFSDPYAQAKLAMLTNKESNITSEDDVNNSNVTIAVKLGSTGEFFAKDNYPEANITVLNDESACVTEVLQGKADIFIYDQLTVYRNWQSDTDTLSALFIDQQTPEYWAMATNLDNQELVDEFNAFLEEYINDGGLEDVTEKYLHEEKQAFDELGFTWFFD